MEIYDCTLAIDMKWRRNGKEEKCFSRSEDSWHSIRERAKSWPRLPLNLRNKFFLRQHQNSPATIEPGWDEKSEISKAVKHFLLTSANRWGSASACANTERLSRLATSLGWENPLIYFYRRTGLFFRELGGNLGVVGKRKEIDMKIIIEFIVVQRSKMKLESPFRIHK